MLMKWNIHNYRISERMYNEYVSVFDIKLENYRVRQKELPDLGS
jgi:hypothetical protein